jgi:hypothetical protein
MMFIIDTFPSRRSVGVLLGGSSIANQAPQSKPTECVLLRSQPSNVNAQMDCSAMYPASLAADEEIVRHG